MYWLRLSPLLLLLLSAISCKKTISAETADPGAPVLTARSSFEGVVLDEWQQPISDATVTCGDQTTITSADGAFLFSNVPVDTNAAVVAVAKYGYINGIRTVMARTNATQYLRVMLASKDLTNTFYGNAVGGLQSSAVSVVLSPGQLRNSNNQVYLGRITIAVDYLSPANADFGTRMAGDLRGLDGNGKEVGLQSFGQVAIDLADTSGAPIHTDGAHYADITVAIPGPYRGSAPPHIGLWYLDPVSGYWKQETTASRSGNNYIGNIRQGTRWQFAVSYPVATVETDMMQEGNLPAGRMQTNMVTKISFIAASYGFTNASGHFIGKVPLNQQLILTLNDPCDNILFHKEVGPFSTNSLISPLLTGNLTGCQP